MNLILKDLEYKIFIFLPFLSSFFPPQFIYISSFLSISIGINILFNQKVKLKINFELILLFLGLLFSQIVTLFNLTNSDTFFISNKALITQLGFIFQFVVCILLVNTNFKLDFLKKLFGTIRDNLIILSFLNFIICFLALDQEYQGATSWPSLVTFLYALSDRYLKRETKIFTLVLSLITIIIASKRATILSLIISLIIYNFYNIRNYINSINLFIKKLSIKKSIILIVLILFISCFSFYVNREIIFIRLFKLKDTLDIILNNSTLNKEVQFQLLTGGRNLELKYFLEGLNLSFTNLLTKITTTGIGIGWTNVVTLQASFHNSFILISLVGGLPWLTLCLRIILVSLQNLYINFTLHKEIKEISRTSCLISLALFIDAFFSANFAASFTSLLLFVSPLCLLEKKFSS